VQSAFQHFQWNDTRQIKWTKGQMDKQTNGQTDKRTKGESNYLTIGQMDWARASKEIGQQWSPIKITGSSF